jgi:hypothetical protein
VLERIFAFWGSDAFYNSSPRRCGWGTLVPAMTCWPLVLDQVGPHRRQPLPWDYFRFAVKLISLLPLCGGLDVHQYLIECRTIKKPAVRDHDADFPSVPDVFERVCAQQHQIGDLSRFD